MAKSVLSPALAAVLGLLAPHAATAATPLITGAATYELTLDGDSAVGGAMLDLSGTMTAVITLACETYRTEVDLAVDLKGPGGGSLPMRIKSVHVEDPESLTFELLGELASIEVDRAKGVGRRTDDGVAVSLAQPKSEEQSFAGNVLFPLAMLRETVAAARAGERLVEFQTYDGSGYGRQVWRVSVLITEADEADDIDEEAPVRGGTGLCRHEPLADDIQLFLAGNGRRDDPGFLHGDHRLRKRLFASSHLRSRAVRDAAEAGRIHADTAGAMSIARACFGQVDAIPFLDRRVPAGVEIADCRCWCIGGSEIGVGGRRSETRRDGRTCAKSVAANLARIPDTSSGHRLDLAASSPRRNAPT